MLHNFITSHYIPEALSKASGDIPVNEIAEWRQKQLDFIGDNDVAVVAGSQDFIHFSGVCLVRKDTHIFWVAVYDNGWECEEPGEVDEYGNVVRESYGSSIIETDIVDLSKDRVALLTFREQCFEGSTLGIIHAVQVALREKQMNAERLFPLSDVYDRNMRYVHDKIDEILDLYYM